jgi:hypothetical protein
VKTVRWTNIRRAFEPPIRLFGAFLAVNWLIGMSRIAVQNSLHCVCLIRDTCAPPDTARNMLESILDLAAAFYGVVSETYAAAWFPPVERILGILIVHVPTWLIELTTLAIFTMGAAGRASSYAHEQVYVRRHFNPWSRRFHDAWASGLRPFASEVFEGVLVALHYPTHKLLILAGNAVIAKKTMPLAERFACRLVDNTLKKMGVPEDETPRVQFRRNASSQKPEVLALHPIIGSLTHDAFLNHVLFEQQKIVVKVHTWIVIFLSVLGMVLIFETLGYTCAYFLS